MLAKHEVREEGHKHGGSKLWLTLTLDGGASAGEHVDPSGSSSSDEFILTST